jgi:hypothetical protein
VRFRVLAVVIEDTSDSRCHQLAGKEIAMNEDAFNMSVRKFLKQVGITAQREIEGAVREALAQGSLGGHAKLPAKAVVTLAGTDLNLVVDGQIELE